MRHMTHETEQFDPSPAETFTGLLIMFITAALAASVCSAIATLAVLH
jgi:hypothetical protein